MSDEMVTAKRIAELEAALKVSADRWRDLAAVIEESGPYGNAGFARATARRCYEVLGVEYDD